MTTFKEDITQNPENILHVFVESGDVEAAIYKNDGVYVFIAVFDEQGEKMVLCAEKFDGVRDALQRLYMFLDDEYTDISTCPQLAGH